MPQERDQTTDDMEEELTQEYVIPLKRGGGRKEGDITFEM